MNYESKKRGICLRQVVFLVLAVLLFCQCEKLTNPDNLSDTSFNDASKNRVQITGTILHRDIYSHTKEVSIEIPYISEYEHTRRLTVPISDEGTFHFDFELAQPQDIRMITYFDFLYLKPGDSLHIELDFKDLTNAKLSGNPTNVVDINHQLHNYFDNTFYRKGDYSIGTNSHLNSSLVEIVNELNRKRSNNRTQQALFCYRNKVLDEVKILTESMIDLDYYVELVSIMQMRSLYNKNVIDSDLLMSELNEQIAKHFNSGLYSASHFLFISNAYLPVLLESNKFEKNEKTIDWIKRTISNNTIKNFAFATTAGSALNMKDIGFFQDLYAEIDQKYLLERLMSEYELVWLSMNNPEFASNGILGEPNDFASSSLEKETNPLPKLIKQNKGKVQVIDIWATWCSPCISSLEEYKKLMTQYTDEDVEFIFICANSTSESYDKIIQSKGMNKEHFYLCSQEESQSLTRVFLGLVFPTGILVNKKGVIVDYGTHLRPEFGLSAKIDHLLKHDKLTVQ